MKSRSEARLWGAVLALAALVPAGAARAQLLLPDGEFHDDEGSWVAADGDSSLDWSPLDRDGCTGVSGSALATNGGAAASAGRNFVPDCISPVVAGGIHSFRGRFRFPTGQTRTGSARLVLVWTTGPGCTGTVSGSYNSADIGTATAGTWITLSAFGLVAPVGTQSASVRVRVQKTEAGGDLAMNFDGIELARGSLLFAHGFESGSTCGWSSISS